MPLFKAFPTGTIVGDTDTQTLTNKTITSPSIGTPTFTGAPTIPTTGGFVKMKLVTSTYDLSTASGTQTITGAGFTPKAVIICSNKFGTSGWSMGLGDGGGAFMMASPNDATTVVNNNAIINHTNAAGTASQQATLSSFTSDGATLAWTKVGSPTGTLAIALLFLA